MQKSRNQSGRSMVEISGVLAVIGVLSIGGIQGYKYAMDKYRANEVVREVNARITDIWHLYQDPEKELPDTADDEHAFEEWDTLLNSGFPSIITAHKNDLGESVAFKVWVDNVPQGVCQRILDMNPQDNIEGVSYLTVNDVRYTGEATNEVCLDGEDGSLLIFTTFLEDLGFTGDEEFEEPQLCTLDTDCKSICAETECDKTRNVCGCTPDTDGTTRVCNKETGECERVRACEKGKEFRAKSGICMPCDSNAKIKISQQDEPYYISEGERDEVNPRELCDACAERNSGISPKDNELYCFKGCLYGLGYTPISGYEGHSWWPFTYDKYAHVDYQKLCISCDNPYNYLIVNNAENRAACLACPNHYIFNAPLWPGGTVCGNKCKKGKTFMSYHYNQGFAHIGGNCMSCNATFGSRIIPSNTSEVNHQDLCRACGKKVLGSHCITECKQTATERKFMSAPHGVNAMQAEAACYSCSTDSQVTILWGKSNSADWIKYFEDLCMACNDVVDKDGNPVHPRKLITDEKTGNVLCVKGGADSCAEDEFLDKDLKCRKCSLTTRVAITSDVASGCSAKCNGTTTVNGVVNQKRRAVIDDVETHYCYPDTCQEGEFQGYDGKCYACDTKSEISLDGGWYSGNAIREFKTECSSRCTKEEEQPDGTTKTIYLREVDSDVDCVYKESSCPDTESGEKQFRKNNNACTPCSTKGIVTILNTDAHKAECNSCPSVSNDNLGRTSNDGNCALIEPGVTGTCNSLGDFSGNNPYEDGDGWLFRSSTGQCYECNTPGDISTSSAQCATCGDMRVQNGSLCTYNTGCTSGIAFWNSEARQCTGCSAATKNRYKTMASIETLCVDCGMRVMKEINSDGEEITYCAKKCDDGKWQDINGVCFDCSKNNSAGNVIGSDEESQKLCIEQCNRTVSKNANDQFVCNK